MLSKLKEIRKLEYNLFSFINNIISHNNFNKSIMKNFILHNIHITYFKKNIFRK